MDTLVIHQSRLTGGLVWHSELALKEAGRALVTVWVDSKGILASRSGERHLVVFTCTTVHGPVVVAMIVHGTLSIE